MMAKKIRSISISQTDTEFWLQSGIYEIRLPTKAKDSLTINGANFTLTRNGKPVVRISQVSKPTEQSIGEKGNFALEFNVDAVLPERHRVIFRTLKDTTPSQTIEFWAQRNTAHWDSSGDEGPPSHIWIAGFGARPRISTNSAGKFNFLYEVGYEFVARNPTRGVGEAVHLAAVRDADAGEIRFYVNGHRTSSKKAPPVYGARPFGICTQQWGGAEKRGYTGWIDELRISSVARYIDDFDPELRFESDDNTLALYHFDEGKGTVLTDSSGNHHDGEVHGAKWIRLPINDHGYAAVIPNSTPPENSASSVDQRAVAEWLLKNAGRFTDRHGTRFQGLDTLVPEGPLQISGVSLYRATDAKVTKLANWIRDIPGCRGASFWGGKNHEITDACMPEICQLSQLSLLSLHEGQITDDGISHIREMPMLNDLKLVNLAIGVRCLEHLQKSCPQLTTLELRGETVVDQSLAALSDMKMLAHFCFGSSKFSATAAGHIVDSEITHLTLRDIPLIDVGAMEILAQDGRLQYLSLPSCRFGDAHLAQLITCKTLETLGFDKKNRITAEALRQFIRKRPDIRVNISDPESPLLDVLAEPR